MIHKAGRIYPYFLTAFALEFLVKEGVSKVSLFQTLRDLIQSVWTLSFLYMIGLPDVGFMGVVWYISSMLLCMAVLYPFLYCNKELYLRVIAPVTALFSYVWMDSYTGGNGLGVGAVREWVGICYLGTVRALGGISLGGIIWSAVEYLRRIRIRGKTIRLFLTGVECLGYTVAIYACYGPVSGKLTYAILAVLAGSLVLTGAGCTYSAKLTGGFLPRYLGRLSISVYLFQLSAIFIIWYLASEMKWIPYRYESMLPWYLTLDLLIAVMMDQLINRLFLKHCLS